MRMVAATGSVVSLVLLLAGFAPRGAQRESRGTPQVHHSAIQMSPALSEDAATAADQDYIERFEIAKDGAPLIIPVNVDGDEYPFLVDTGLSGTVLDPSLCTHLRAIQDGVQINGVGGYTLYSAPKMTVGRSRIPVRGGVLGVDLFRIRKMNQEGFRGILGMTFLGFHVVEIDFDEGTLTFRRTAQHSSGTQLPLLSIGQNLPALDVSIGQRTDSFLIDTGSIGASGGALEGGLFDDLVRTGELECVDGPTQYTTINGVFESTYGVLRSFIVGESIQSHLRFRRGDVNIIGLTYLSRYRVTLDFPNATIVLTPR